MTQWLIPAALIVIAVVIAPDNPKQAARKAATKRRKAARCWQQPAHSRRGYNVDPAQIEAMEAQINAACELGIALDSRSRSERDAVKRARLAQQSANAYARAARIRAQIDKMMLTA